MELEKEMTKEQINFKNHPFVGVEWPVTGSKGDQYTCLLYTSPSPRDAHESRMPSSA